MKRALRDYFIPYEGNQFRPQALQRVSVGVMALLVIISFAIATAHSTLWRSSEWLVSSILPAVIVDLTNDERADGSASTLARNPILDEAARRKAEHMATNSYFSHYSPDGTSPWYWFDSAGYRFVHAGENLAVYFSDSDDVVDAWMDSPTHRANIMNGKFTEIGVGTARGTLNGTETVFVVQLFGTPVAQTLAYTEDVTVTAEEPVGPVAAAGAETVDAKQTETAPAVSEKTEPAPTELATTTRATTSIGSIDTPRPESSVIGRVATQPHSLLQMLYGALALFVAVALTLSIAIEWRRQHLIHLVYSGGLYAGMLLLFHIHIALTSGVTII